MRADPHANPYSCRVAKNPARAPEPEPASRQEHVLAVMFIAILGLSIAAMLAIIIVGANATGPIWSAVTLLPLIGFPIAILLLVSVVILNAVRRGRAAKGVRK